MEIAASPLIGDVLRRHAERQPERTAFTFLQDGIHPSQSLSYAELDRQARVIAAFLQPRLAVGERVMLCFPEGTEFIAALFGCFYAGMIAVPAPSPDQMRMKRSCDRLHAIRSNAAPALLLGAAPSELLSAAFEGATWAYTGELDDQLVNNWQPPLIGGDDLAYLQYTSGSMTTPKGVMIRHRNLMHNLQELQATWPYGPDGVAASWMPNFHDYGLVAGILRPLYVGVPAYLSSPRAFLRQPSSWLKMIARYRVTHSGAAAFAYNYCVQKISPEELTGLDLSCWRVATVGAEPIRPQTLQAFADTFAASGFRFQSFCPGYGMAELTLLATGHAKDGSEQSAPTILQNQPGPSLIGCGRTSDSTTLIVVDPETCMRVPESVAGEIWIAGPSVAAGYWQQAEETRAAFNAFLSDTGEGPFFRSGDIGFLRDRELFVTGRLKNMIIIHGENYYAEEIEWVLQQAHPSIRHHVSAVFAVPGKRTEQVVIVHELDQPSVGSIDADAVMGALRRSVAEYFGLPVYGVALVKRGTIPRTTSGKVQRLGCRAAYLDGTLAQLASWTLDEEVALAPEPVVEGVEAALIRIWQELFDVPVVMTTSDFFDLGGDSLLTLQLMLAVEEQFGQSLPDGFFRQPTIAHLAHLLQRNQDAAPAGLRPFPAQPQQRERSAMRSGGAATMRAVFKGIVRSLRAPAERAAFRLPYPLGRRWLAMWVALPWVQAILYPNQRRLMRGFLAGIGSPLWSEQEVLQAALADHIIATRLKTLTAGHALTDTAPYEAVIGAGEHFWEPFSEAVRAATRNEPLRQVVFSNLAALEHIEHGRGVILLTYHTPYHRLAMLALLTLKRKSIFFLHRAAVTATVRQMAIDLEGVEDAKISPRALATHVQLARSCLGDGGIVVIAGDSVLGRSTPISLQVHGRWFPFKTGFAELALHTGAVVLPMAVSSEPDHRLRIAFKPPLDPGSTNMPHAERVHLLVQQYATFFEDSMREAPEMVTLDKMQSFLTYERVTEP